MMQIIIPFFYSKDLFCRQAKEVFGYTKFCKPVMPRLSKIQPAPEMFKPLPVIRARSSVRLSDQRNAPEYPLFRIYGGNAADVKMEIVFSVQHSYNMFII